MLYRDFDHWEKPYDHAGNSTVIFRVFEIASRLLTRHFYLVPWMDGNVFSFGNVNYVGFFKLVTSLYNNKNNTWFLGDKEFLFKCSTRSAHSWDISSWILEEKLKLLRKVDFRCILSIGTWFPKHDGNSKYKCCVKCLWLRHFVTCTQHPAI